MKFETYIWFIIVFIVSSCTRNKQLDYALLAAGENKQEQESVLKHFKDDPQKRNATNFLIENISKSPKNTIGAVPSKHGRKTFIRKTIRLKIFAGISYPTVLPKDFVWITAEMFSITVTLISLMIRIKILGR